MEVCYFPAAVSRIFMELGLTFDDVLILPRESSILPDEANLATRLTSKIMLKTPIISSPMDTVTEHKMAIALAKSGGIGIIHKNMSVENQVNEVRAVKRHFRWMIDVPVTIRPEMSVSDASAIISSHGFSGAPVVDGLKLVGLLTNRDMRFTSSDALVSDVMSKERLITTNPDVSYEEAMAILAKNKIERLVVVDGEYNCVGLITMADMRKSIEYPSSALDADNQLLVGAAVGVRPDVDHARAHALRDAGADVLVVDTAHGHSSRVFEMVRWLKSTFPDLQVIAGNIATAEAAEYLIRAGADAVKVGIGPGSICTTRIVAGVGAPQLSAIMQAAVVCKRHDIPLIADGGMRTSGDVSKAIAAGASSVMLGSMLAGSKESPGAVVVYKGRSYKSYRGMGSMGAMADGSADRYGHSSMQTKMVAEGVEGIVPCRGKALETIARITGGLRSAMGYTGSHTIQDMQNNCQFIRITSAGLNESHTHGVHITQEEPFYNE